MTDIAGAIDYDVLVVGFGPTGAIAAGQLGRLGHRTLVIDRLTDVYDKPRAIALDHEIFRHFDNMGLTEAISPHIEPFTASEHFGVDGQLIRRIDMVAKPYPLGYTPSMVFSQPAVEAELRRHARSFSNVHAELGVELLGLVQTPDRVEAQLKDGDGRQRSVTARYVIGCDGASSTVRQIAGLVLEDLIFDEPWLVVDVRVNENALARLPQCSAQFCNPARPVSFLIGPRNHRRWEIMLLPGEDARQMERPDNVWKLLAPWLTPGDGELWRAASYRFHALVADEWRNGRILIAGDAAHQQPPFIGQGMCQGLRDATNLVWKLDHVLRGVSSDSLLDSYTAERKQHVIELTGKIKAIGQSICERDPAAARRRDAQILADGGGKPLLLTRQEIIPPLRAGFWHIAKHPRAALCFRSRVSHVASRLACWTRSPGPAGGCSSTAGATMPRPCCPSASRAPTCLSPQSRQPARVLRTRSKRPRGAGELVRPSRRRRGSRSVRPLRLRYRAQFHRAQRSPGRGRSAPS